MKSDIIHVTNAGEGMDAALEQASASAAYRGLTEKNALHLRLLAEEMLGMFRQITGNAGADFWLDSEGNRFELHLSAWPIITEELRRNLLSVSSSGKNAAAVGVMGKLRDIFERAFASARLEAPSDYSRYYLQGLLISPDPDTVNPMTLALDASLNAEAINWSLNRYKAAVELKKTEVDETREEWDELEKSIVANIADEVSISIRNGNVEMIVYKTFDK